MAQAMGKRADMRIVTCDLKREALLSAGVRGLDFEWELKAYRSWRLLVLEGERGR